MTSKSEHFVKGACSYLAVVAEHRQGVLQRMKNKGNRGVHIVEVKEDWLGKTWGEGNVDKVHAVFVDRKNIKKAVPAIQGDLLSRVLVAVDTYKPKKGELCFFIFVCSPDVKEAIVQTI